MALTGKTCRTAPTKFVDPPDLPGLDLVVLRSKMALFGLVVLQEVAGEMTCPTDKWAMVEVVVLATVVLATAAAAEAVDGVT